MVVQRTAFLAHSFMGSGCEMPLSVKEHMKEEAPYPPQP